VLSGGEDENGDSDGQTLKDGNSFADDDWSIYSYSQGQ